MSAANRVEILPTAEQVVQWIIDHPDLTSDEDIKGAFNRMLSSNVDSDNESTSSENLNLPFLSQQDKQAKFAKRDDFKSGDQYATYVRTHICPGQFVFSFISRATNE